MVKVDHPKVNELKPPTMSQNAGVRTAWARVHG
jgi:hypothetical protein